MTTEKKFNFKEMLRDTVACAAVIGSFICVLQTGHEPLKWNKPVGGTEVEANAVIQKGYKFESERTYVTASHVNSDGSLEDERECFLLAGSSIQEIGKINEKGKALYSINSLMFSQEQIDNFPPSIPGNLCTPGSFYVVVDSMVVDGLVSADQREAESRKNVRNMIEKHQAKSGQ